MTTLNPGHVLVCSKCQYSIGEGQTQHQLGLIVIKLWETGLEPALLPVAIFTPTPVRDSEFLPGTELVTSFTFTSATIEYFRWQTVSP